MDYLRSCYTTQAIFKTGGHQSGLRWYFAPDGAQLFPAVHVFSSLNWCKPDCNVSDLGEVIGAARPWSNGATPVEAQGFGLCGDPAEFHDGISDYLPSDRPEYPDGLPMCCPTCTPVQVEFGTLLLDSWPSFSISSQYYAPLNRYIVSFSVFCDAPFAWPPSPCGPLAQVVASNCPIPDGYNPGDGARKYYWWRATGDDGPVDGACADWMGACFRYAALQHTAPFTLDFTLEIC